MAVFVRIRAWRARRNERKNEQLIAQAAVGPKNTSDAKRAAYDNLRGAKGTEQGPGGGLS
jgi:hypothetical protein